MHAPVDRPALEPPAPSDVERIREDFPILSQRGARQAAGLSRQRRHQPEAPRGHRRHLPLLRRARTPTSTAGVHYLSERATVAYDAAARAGRAVHQRRVAGRDRLHPRAPPRRSTSSPRAGAGRSSGPGDEILITGMEHHSNIVPWQLVCEQTGATLRAVPITDAGELDLDGVRPAAHRPHPAGRRGPPLQRAGHDQPGARMLSRWRMSAASWCWWTARSRRPTCRWTSRRWTATSSPSRGTSCSARPASACSTAARRCSTAMPPWQGGGDMIETVTLERTTWAPPPARFEAGTPPIAAGDRALAAAIDYVEASGAAGDRRLGGGAAGLRHRAGRRASPGVRLVGTARGEGERALVRGRGRAPARRRHGAGRRGRRDPRRPPLRAAAHAAVRGPGDGARLVRLLQHARTRSTRWCAGCERVRKVFA